MRISLIALLVTAQLAVLSACAGGAPVGVDQAQALIYLTSDRTADELDELGRIAPNVQIISGLDRKTALEHAASAHGIDAHLVTDEFLANATDLRWVQAWSAGVDRYLGFDRLMDDDTVTFTNMKGVHGPAIAEHVFAMLLSLTRRLSTFKALATLGTWDRSASDGMTALAGQTMLVVGLGGIGREVARRAKAFDMVVLATARTPREPPPYVDRLGVAADLDSLLPEADVVVVCVPLTPATERMFDAGRFARMKHGAYLVNIARGRVVDTDALLDALDSDALAGAALDVTDPEPLPPDHRLWRLENVVITPHVASHAEITDARRWSVFVENVRRFARGEQLTNIVDKSAGY